MSKKSWTPLHEGWEIAAPFLFFLLSLFPSIVAFDDGLATGISFLVGQLVLTAGGTVAIFLLFWRHFRRKWTPSPEFPPDGVAVVEARVVEAEEVLESPHTGRRCVAWGIVEPSGRYRPTLWRVRPFLLEDTKGRGRIRIEPRRGAFSDDLPELTKATSLRGLSVEERGKIEMACHEAGREKWGYDHLPLSPSPGLRYHPLFEFVVAEGDVVLVRGSFIKENSKQEDPAAPTFTMESAALEMGSAEELFSGGGYHRVMAWWVSLMAASLVALMLSMVVNFS